MESVRPEVLAFYDNMAIHIVPFVILITFILFLLIRWARKRKNSSQKPLEDLYNVVEESVYEAPNNLKELTDNIKRDFKK